MYLAQRTQSYLPGLRAILILVRIHSIDGHHMPWSLNWGFYQWPRPYF
jgi:hypothetical protein